MYPQCFCGRNSDDPDDLGGATCNMACTGDENETCGGRSAMNVYEYTESLGEYAGCFVDSTRDRVLTGDYISDSDMTPEVRVAGQSPVLPILWWGGGVFCKGWYPHLSSDISTIRHESVLSGISYATPS